MKTKNKNTILAIIVSIVASVIPALIFGKWLEAIIFLVCHTLIRPQYPKQYHHIIPACCRIITAATFFFGICFILPLELSLLSSILISFIISLFGYISQDRLDKITKIKVLKLRINQLLCNISHKYIYAMNKEELYQHCRNCGLDDADCKIAYYVVIERLKGKELYDAIGYSEAQSKRKRTKILKLINN